MFAVLYLLSTLMLSVNADFPTCWEFEVAYGDSECMNNTPCWSTDKPLGQFIDSYQIEIAGGYLYHAPHNRIDGDLPICRRELATGALECPVTNAQYGGNMVGLTVDPATHDIYYGASECVGHWNSETDTHVSLGCTCRIWGMSFHQKTKDIYFGCRESGQGLYRLEYDESQDNNYKSAALINTESWYVPFTTIDQTIDVLYFTDYVNNQVKSMTLDGSFTTTVLAGTGTQGFSGDGGLATDAELDYPTGIAKNMATGDIYIYDQSDRDPKRIRMIEAATGDIQTVASGAKNMQPPSLTDIGGGWWDASGETANYPLASGDVGFSTCCGAGSLAIDQDTQELYFGNTYDSTVLKILPGSVESSQGQCVRLEPQAAPAAEEAATVDGYTHTAEGCVVGKNIQKLRNKSAAECAELCTAYGTACVGFELYRNYGGSKGGYQPGDCNLQSDTDMTGCDGTKYNLDFYTRTNFAGSPDLISALEALAVWSDSVELSTQVSCADFDWLSGCTEDPSVCPTTHPYAYRPSHGYDHCCATDKDSSGDVRGSGGNVESCQNNDHVKCSAGSGCVDYNGVTYATPTNDDMVKFTAMVASNYYTLDGFQPILTVNDE